MRGSWSRCVEKSYERVVDMKSYVFLDLEKVILFFVMIFIFCIGILWGVFIFF